MKINTSQFKLFANSNACNNIKFYIFLFIRDQARQRLQGKPDGSYLVRESESEKGQWTLAVK